MWGNNVISSLEANIIKDLLKEKSTVSRSKQKRSSDMRKRLVNSEMTILWQLLFVYKHIICDVSMN